MRVNPKALFLSVSLVLIVSVTIWRGLSDSHTPIPSSSTPFLELSSVSKPEFPARAAALVRAADSASKEQTARDALRAAAILAKPGVLVYVVSSICLEVPEVAPVVVATAIELQPADMDTLVWAAAANAPQQAEGITYAVCRSAPEKFDTVASIVFEASPTAGSGILRGLTNALPELQPIVETAIRQTGTDEIGPVIEQTLLLRATIGKKR